MASRLGSFGQFVSLRLRDIPGVWCLQSLCNQPYDGANRASPPTADSIRRIDQVLKVTLPPAFARFAEEGPICGTWFASIGADYESRMHILKLNEGFREPNDEGKPLPPDLILFSHGHDGDCHGLDHGLDERSKQYSIRYWNQYKGLASPER
jgi:hypothetical protein